jgi:hypothetical protein
VRASGSAGIRISPERLISRKEGGVGLALPLSPVAPTPGDKGKLPGKNVRPGLDRSLLPRFVSNEHGLITVGRRPICVQYL